MSEFSEGMVEAGARALMANGFYRLPVAVDKRSATHSQVREVLEAALAAAPDYREQRDYERAEGHKARTRALDWEKAAAALSETVGVKFDGWPSADEWLEGMRAALHVGEV